VIRPPGFSLLSLCVATMLACALGSGSHADETAMLPKLKNAKSVDFFYPAGARRLSLQGRVLTQFGISGKGRVVDLQVISAEPPGVFEGAITTYLRSMDFDVPSDWEASGGLGRRYRLGFVFLLRPCRSTIPCEEVQPYQTDLQPVIVTTTPLSTGSGH
jgi:hypothetical protein